MVDSESSSTHGESEEDILSESLELLGGVSIPDDTSVRYGPLVLTTAPKEGKANTLLADHVFSPALFLAELIERGLISFSGRTVVEIGAGTALPSLLAATLPPPSTPSLVVVTDHPDPIIIGALERNVRTNQHAVNHTCKIVCRPYEWGEDVGDLLSYLPSEEFGYGVLILSDLLHFDASHAALLRSLTSLLARTSVARAYVAAGTYTPQHICDRFLIPAEAAGIEWTEWVGDAGENSEWKGEMVVRGAGLDREGLGRRKRMVRLWIGRWGESALAADSYPPYPHYMIAYVI